MHNLGRNLKALCLTIDGATKPDGSLNVSKSAEELGIHQPTLLRMLKGEVERARPGNEEKILNYFRISAQRLYSDDLAERLMKGDHLSQLEKAKEIIKTLSKKERAQLFMDEAPELVEFFTKED